MTRIVSVVTAVHEPAVAFLVEAYASLAAQVMPAGWGWQWVIQEDGTTGRPRDVLPDDSRISFDVGRPLGQGIARTYALARAGGELVKVLDADDALAPGALAREIDVLSEHGDIGWTTCRALDRCDDGSTREFTGAPSGGRLDRGQVLAAWLADEHRLPVHPATLCIRRDLLLALGGWMALPAGEDTGLLLAADAVSPGYFIDQVGQFYRKWPGQVTADPAHTEPVEWTARNAVIEERARTLAVMFPTGWPR